MDEKPEWPEVMTFRPSMEEFSNLKTLLTSMENQGAHKAGIAKIVPPVSWVPRAKGYQPRDIKIDIEAPIQQTIAQQETVGAFQANHKKLPKLRVEEFR